ncbi:MAG: hydantoinase/oxoprolinase family protein [Spirochaetales bacterium]|nr:hydantoinase/oxoprolinase family protein [Spirochaetales bacterium]
MKYRLGIDVGGTNTDAVILDENNKVVAKCKEATTSDISTGITKAVKHVLKESGINPSDIADAMLGTTHATNAIVERKGLSKVGVIRISGPSGYAIPPFIEWPEDILKVINHFYVIVKGGYEYNGELLSDIDEDEIRDALKQIKDKGAEALAISGVFSLVNDEQEKAVAELAHEVLGEDFPVTMSNEIGSIGIIERENAAILNAAIRKLADSAYSSFQDVLRSHNIEADLFITQNDGTLMSIEYAKQYPVLTIASGPTNSLRGAAFLTGMKEAIVADVGGTTTDVGVLSKGFPRESSSAVEIGGVRTNFRMPDLITLGLGGGSEVKSENGKITVGPQSVGYRIHTEAKIFGGNSLTATDIAVAAGMFVLGDKTKVSNLSPETVADTIGVIKAMIEEVIDKMKTMATDLPVIVVGGGSILIPDSLVGASQVIKPEHFEVANAIGAAISQVSGSIDGVYDIVTKGREAVIEEVKAAAMAEAVKAGADESTLEIVELEEIPLAYLPSNAVRFRVKAVGELKR